jgi:hypothetical protein
MDLPPSGGDDTDAINTALACHTVVELRPGHYQLSGPIKFTQNGQKLIGTGPGSTVLHHKANNTPGIQVQPYLTNWGIVGFTSRREPIALSGADGIYAPISCAQSFIGDLVIEGSYRGISAGSTDFSRIQNVTCQRNYSDGFHFTNSSAYGAVQWNLSKCLAGGNNGNGFLFMSSAGPSAVALGALEECASFSNNGHGVAFIGLPSVPIHGIRLLGGFYGEDGNHVIYLDTYGGLHSLRGVFTELAGCGATGISGTPATHLGSGFYITANNRDVSLSDCRADGNSRNGATTLATTTQISGGSFTGNGKALASFNRIGIACGAGRLIVNGATSGDFGAGCQQYGVLGADGADTVVIGSDLKGNLVAGVSSSTRPELVTSIGNLT